jgi:hypothetical protein
MRRGSFFDFEVGRETRCRIERPLERPIHRGEILCQARLLVAWPSAWLGAQTSRARPMDPQMQQMQRK